MVGFLSIPISLLILFHITEFVKHRSFAYVLAEDRMFELYSDMMDDYLCLKCFQGWKGRVQEYRDWKRRKCPHCGSRQTVKRNIYDRAVAAVADSLESSPPPLPPLPSAVLACLDVINVVLPDPGLGPRVFLRIYEEARGKVRGGGSES